MLCSVVLAGVLAAGGCSQSLVDSDDNAVIQASLDSLPRNVVDLTVVNRTATTLRLRLTEVEDGLGSPANYAVRFADQPFSWSDAVSTEFIIDGWRVGDPLEFAVTGLVPGTEYYVQCAAFRGTLGVDAVFSPQLSNVASGTTDTSNPPPPPGPDEPIFDPAAYNSLWHDDFSSYTSEADMQSGAGAHPWNGQWGLWSLNTGGRNGTRYMRHNFQAAGQYGDEIYAADDELAGQDPPVVIMTMWVRNFGTQYAGKMQVQKSNGSGRWVFVMTSNNPYSLDLTATYWDIVNHQGNTYPAVDPSQSLPTYTAYGATLNRDMDCAGFATWSYKQNRNWGNLKPPQNWNDGNWHRWTVRWTKGGGSGPCGDGRGRIEWWWDGVLIQQWIGDDPSRPEYGLVYTAGSGTRVIYDPAYFGPSRFNWAGGGYVDLDEIRYFTPK